MNALVVGTGLIGTSVGAGLRVSGWKVAGWDPSPVATAQAESMGALDTVVTEPFDASKGVELVVMAGPVSAIIAGLGSLETDALVTDVAGVKGSVVAAGGRLTHFVGGHPMAGRESSGPGAASASMFRGASWILTTDGAARDDVDRVAEVVAGLGAVPVRMTAAEHDAAIAAVSHLPQVLASTLVNVVSRDQAALSLAAGGFRDLTRIAMSEPAWWTDVLAENRVDVARLARVVAVELEDWAGRLDGGDRLGIERSLGSARDARRRLSAPVATVPVLLEDQPGEIARIGQALAETGVDVRDLQLRHATRGGGGVLTLSVRPGQEDRLRDALEAGGFRLVD